MSEIIRMDDRAECGRCGGTAHDYVSHAKGEVTIQCCYCLQFAKVFGEPPSSAFKGVSERGSYVLKHGRYKGSSVSDVASLGERGVEYLRLLAKDSPKMAPIINEYFDSCTAVGVKAASHSLPHRPPSREEASISDSQ
jgi:hypothetical protein